MQIVARFLLHLIISNFASICRFSFSFPDARFSVFFSSTWSFFLYLLEWINHCTFLFCCPCFILPSLQFVGRCLLCPWLLLQMMSYRQHISIYGVYRCQLPDHWWEQETTTALTSSPEGHRMELSPTQNIDPQRVWFSGKDQRESRLSN